MPCPAPGCCPTPHLQLPLHLAVVLLQLCIVLLRLLLHLAQRFALPLQLLRLLPQSLPLALCQAGRLLSLPQAVASCRQLRLQLSDLMGRRGAEGQSRQVGA
jgi:hypothetical protein